MNFTKNTILVSIILLILSACQGRHMPMHPSAQLTNTSSINSNKVTILKLVNKLKIVKEKIMPATKFRHQERKATSLRKKTLVPILKKLSDTQTKKVTKLPKKSQKYLSKDSDFVKTLPKPKVKKYIGLKQPKENFSGGGIANDLDMATIRIGKSTDYTSIIFDSYIYEGKNTLPSKKSTVSGAYLFTYTPNTNQIIGLLDGYHAFSALLSDQKALFSDNDIVKNIYVLKRMGNDGIKFVIQLSKKVRANIFDVKNPGRIIVNLFPL